MVSGSFWPLVEPLVNCPKWLHLLVYEKFNMGGAGSLQLALFILILRTGHNPKLKKLSHFGHWPTTLHCLCSFFRALKRQKFVSTFSNSQCLNEMATSTWPAKVQTHTFHFPSPTFHVLPFCLWDVASQLCALTRLCSYDLASGRQLILFQ